MVYACFILHFAKSLMIDLSLSVMLHVQPHAHFLCPGSSFYLCYSSALCSFSGYKMNKRVGAIEEFEFLPLSPGKHLHVTVAVTGWLCSGKYSSVFA